MALYKYVTAARIDILKTKLIAFTPPSGCNDPFELMPLIESILDPIEAGAEIRNRVWSSSDLKTVVDFASSMDPGFQRDAEEFVRIRTAELLKQADPHLRQLYVDKFIENLGILSLTEDPLNLLMWAHYGDAYRGFVIEFNERDDWFHRRKGPNDDLREVRKVRYVDSPSPRFLTKLTDSDVLYSKSEKWAYEKEWRMLLPLAEHAHKTEAGIYLFGLAPEIITGIILGPRMAPSTREELLTLTRKTPAWEHVVIRQGVIHTRSHRVMIEGQGSGARSLAQR